MKRAMFFSVLGLLLVTPLWANPQNKMPNSPEERVRRRDATASALTRLISSKLPEQDRANIPAGTEIWSWNVSYQPQYDTIEVRRDPAVLMTPSIGINGPAIVKRTQVLSHPTFAFRIEPFISPKEYARLKSENATINQRLTQMAGQMRDIRHKFDSYLPKTEVEKQKVDAYNKLKRSLHDLPDFYFRDITLSWLAIGDDFLFHQPGETPLSLKQTDEKKGWRYERVQAVKAVLALLSRYEPETN
ncbi:hypothetical protein IAD21_03184 [Abditibacteriota bacterium]|nr:hypothetical protein IAD21_03184 [Abditibacteriota bacterium]